MSLLKNVFLINDSNQVSKLLVSLLVSLIAIQIFKRLWEIFRLPSGPYGLPFIGYLPFIDDNQGEQYTRLGKKYGSPFSIHLGKYDFVIINDWFHANEAMSREELLARPPEGILSSLLNKHGLVDLSGKAWKDQRRTALHLMRDIGMGKSGKPFNILDLLSASISNNISILNYGKRFEYDDEEKLELDRNIKNFVENTDLSGLAIAMPLVMKILRFFGNVKYNQLMQTGEKSERFDNIQIGKHQNKEHEHLFDYIDGFLAKMEERKKKGIPLESFTFPVLRSNISNLYTAGSTTIHSTTSWMILFLVKYLHYQSRMRQEIFQIIGTRSPSYQDHYLMPFTWAFIHETLRYRTNVPINLPRFCTKDVYLGKHLIPRGTIVVINFYAIDHDPTLWSDPQKFYPERFLPGDQSKAVFPSHLTPFAAGKRKCIGESLALVELFLYITNLVQKYILTAGEGSDRVFDERKNGIVSYPLHMPQIVIQPVELENYDELNEH
ncbi:cytochrome P450 2J6-like [Brevipalpus obovatus]|uniref:cytochrome P450 2J6-like n=1 Tax=Brevipalpus obovatus TaxID=246614 RepID=UPI003D9F495E